MEKDEIEAINKDGEDTMNDIEKYELFESVFLTVMSIVLLFVVVKLSIYLVENMVIVIDKFLV